VPETIDKQPKTHSKTFKDKLVLGQEAIHELVDEMFDTAVKTLEECHANSWFMKQVMKSITAFNKAKKYTLEDASAFNDVKFPSIVEQEDVDTDQLQVAIVDMIKTLEYGEFDNVFEIRHFLNPGPILCLNFDQDDLHHGLILFLLETDH